MLYLFIGRDVIFWILRVYKNFCELKFVHMSTMSIYKWLIRNTQQFVSTAVAISDLLVHVQFLWCVLYIPKQFDFIRSITDVWFGSQNVDMHACDFILMWFFHVPVNYYHIKFRYAQEGHFTILNNIRSTVIARFKYNYCATIVQKL